LRNSRRSISKPGETSRKPATTPEGREAKMIHMAEQLAEQQLADGTASSQVITHYLKLGSTRERLEQRRLEGEVELQKAKIEALASTQRLEELYTTAMNAFRGYQGQTPDDPEVDDEA
jgi:hypothetical protein